MTPADLKQMQDEFFDWAKFIVDKDGDVMPASFILAYRGNLDKLDGIRAGAMLLDKKHEGWFKTLNDHDVVVVVRPHIMSWEEKFVTLYNALPVDKQPVVAALIQKAEELKVDNKFKRVARPLMDVMECGEKDITAMALRQTCAALDAFAIIMVHTAWALLDQDASKEHLANGATGSIENHPKADEILRVQLEAHIIERVVLMPIYRRGKVRGKGKVKSWGERIEMSTDVNPTAGFSGRFAELLKPLEAATTKA